MILGAFVLLFNLGLFCFSLDVVVVLLEVIATLQTFRAIGMMSSESLPLGVKKFFSLLAIFTLDFEFGVPGCEGTSAAITNMP